MNGSDLIPWVNLCSLHVSAIMFAYFSIISVMPVTREEKRGEKAWKECYWFRIILSIFASIMVINIILWIWFPVPEFNWHIHPDPFFGFLVGVIIAIPCIIILIKAIQDGGEEHMKPSKETELHGGIYKHIRHPGVLGEMPLYIVIALFVNSLFLVIWITLYIVIYVPIYIYFEEKDLIKRFGAPYLEYRHQTGALIPKFWKK
ncbi:MAG: isoprenylcysteine carboxylmethyltransferase family protein [Candidatus Heimdallarchaeota archaeon]|nr:MAG: isoprenylcysteine carboxylmethyltransferase family protein [Candidatus Heimdallarchaeota archaeon]